MTAHRRLKSVFGIQGPLLAVCLILIVPCFAGAAGFDGSSRLLCAPTDAIQCVGAGECERAKVEELNLPRFLTIDFKAKTMTGKVEGEEGEKTTLIQTVEKLESQTVLQGIQNGRGWSIVIDAVSGDLSAAIAGDDLSFVIFGVCQVD
jgi:hypothetical protein